MKKTRPEVHVGQVWRDRDKRSYSGNRLVRVLSIEAGSFATHVYYKQVIGQNRREVDPLFHSQYKRFQDAFDLV